jgi:hypothetical protein
VTRTVARVVQKPKRRGPPAPELSLAEKTRRFEFVENLMQTGAPLSMISALAKEPPPKGLGVVRHVVELVVAEVRAAWREREEAQRSNAKLEQRERLRATLAKAVAAKSFNAAIGAERLLAELDATLAPRRVEVDATLVQREALVLVVAGLDEAELDRIAEEQARLEADAARGRQVVVKELNGHANGKGSAS